MRRTRSRKPFDKVVSVQLDARQERVPAGHRPIPARSHLAIEVASRSGSIAEDHSATMTLARSTS
jgi:hypothetical protein